MWPHTSFEACILRAILSVHSCGTWQSGQRGAHARAVREVDRALAAPRRRWSCISWQRLQNCSVLVASSTVLKPPQKITPATKPAERQEGEAQGAGPATNDLARANQRIVRVWPTTAA